jgi:hypothetical protein
MYGVRLLVLQQQRTGCIPADTPYSAFSGGTLTMKISLFIFGSINSGGKVGVSELGNLLSVFRKIYAKLRLTHGICVL